MLNRGCGDIAAWPINWNPKKWCKISSTHSIHMRMHMHVRPHVHIHIQVHVQIHIHCIYTYICIKMHLYKYIYRCRFMYTYLYIYIHHTCVYQYVQTNSLSHSIKGLIKGLAGIRVFNWVQPSFYHAHHLAVMRQRQRPCQGSHEGWSPNASRT